MCNFITLPPPCSCYDLPPSSLTPIKYCIVPIGQVCSAPPVSNLHPSTPFPVRLSNSITSLSLLVLKQLTTPSNTRTNGITGITYVQNRCPHWPQNQYQLSNHINGAIAITVSIFPTSLPCNSKIANPSLVSSVFSRILTASGSSK